MATVIGQPIIATSIRGTLKADRRTKDLVKRLKPGDIALIHHSDLDSMAARALVECHVAAVINAVHSVSGRYPNSGPGILLEAGIPLIDAVGDAFFDAASKREGSQAEIGDDLITVGKG